MSATSTAPSNPDDYTQVFELLDFIAFQGSTSDPSPGIIQPEVRWTDDLTPGTWNWYIFAEEDIGSDVWSEPRILVNPGAALYLYMQITDGDEGGNGDNWVVGIEDTSTDPVGTSWLGVRTGSANRPFTVANLAVLETHGLLKCSGLSTSNEFGTNNLTLTEEGTSWSDFVPVMGSSIFDPTFPVTSPSCSWYANFPVYIDYSWGDLLQWSY
jgi:hypothetical protein